MASENNNRLDDILAKAIGCEKREPDFAKWQQEHPQAVQMLKSQATRQPHPRRQLDIGRIIMRSPIAKLAAAAAIIVAILAGIYFLTGNPPSVTCCAWAELANRIEQQKTFIFHSYSLTRTDYQKSPQKYPETHQEDDSWHFISSAYGYKMESFDNDSNEETQYYLNFSEKMETEISPKEKEYSHKILTNEELESRKKLYQDPWMIVMRYTSDSNSSTDLGKDVINGVEVRGIQVVPKKDAYCRYIAKVWIDVRTELPVRIEIETEEEYDGYLRRSSRVYDEFEWNTELDPSIFEPNIPADYKVEGSGHEEAAAIEGLKSFAELAKGRYPVMMEGNNMENEIWQLLGEHFNLEEVDELYIGNRIENLHYDYDISDNGHRFNIHHDPNRIEKVNKQLWHKLQKLSDSLYEPFLFYRQHENEGNVPAYYGKDVNASDANAVLMRWKVSDGTYRVIYGDLSIENVTAEKLKEMEQAAHQ